jgi:peptide chain release factor subunit 1
MTQTRTPTASVQGVTWEALRELAGLRAAEGCAISFYLDLNPRQTPTAVELDTRTRALIDEAHKRAEAARDRQTHRQQASVRSGLARIQRYFDSEFSREGVRGVAIFVATEDDLFMPLLLPVTVPDCVRVSDELYLTPLVQLASGTNGALVACVGRERGDVYELRDDRLELVASRFEEQPRRHGQGGWSQARLQRHVDELADRHLRGVAEDLERELRRRRHAQVVLAASDDTRSEFQALLPPDVRAAVAGWTHAEAHAGASELLTAVKPVLERKHAEDEADLLTRWHDLLGQNARASAGWAPTLAAASDSRVDVLVYDSGAESEAWRCPSCGRLQLEGGACPVDGSELEHSQEGLDLLLHTVLGRGGTAHCVTTRPDLGPVGGVGALLRF